MTESRSEASPPSPSSTARPHIPDLYARFPDHGADIDEFMRVSEQVLKRFPLFVMSKAFPAWLQKPWHRYVLGETWQRYAGRSLKDVLQWQISRINRTASLNI